MSIKQIIKLIRQIIEGTISNLLHKEEELYQERIKICRGCILIKDDKIFGEVCNASLYTKPGTVLVSRTAKKGYINGCGCILRSKCRVQEAKCPLGKW